MSSPHRPTFILVFHLISILSSGQLTWINVDTLYQPLPSSVHVFKSTSLLDGKPNIAFYVEADLKDKSLDFTVDTSNDRRLTPTQFFERNRNALLVVNTTFFSFETNRSLNVVIKNSKLVGYNVHTNYGRGKDTFTYRHPFDSALGINKKREADIAWLHTDSSMKYPYAYQQAVPADKDSFISINTNNRRKTEMRHLSFVGKTPSKKWRMKTAVGGGPVLLQEGEIKISNNEELKFGGKAIEDKHPRTAIGYTRDHKLIVLVIEGRHAGSAEGANLVQEARIFKDLGCLEALNLDGGGSSCLLVNGKETIKISDAAGQRPVPAVLLIKTARRR